MHVLNPTGVIGPAEAAELKADLLELCSSERPIIHVDLRQVEELHLSGANSILRAAMEANRRRGTLTVARVSGAGQVRQGLVPQSSARAIGRHRRATASWQRRAWGVRGGSGVGRAAGPRRGLAAGCRGGGGRSSVR